MKDEGGAKVHTGFLKAFEQIQAEVATALEKVAGYQLYVTGHSLGGALALVATRHFNADNLAACYTFGSPKVGSQEFGSSIKPPIYRVVNAADGVPRVPPTWTVGGLHVIAGLIPVAPVKNAIQGVLEKFLGYRHHGDMRYLNATNKPDYADIKVYQNLNIIDRAIRLCGRVTVNWKAPGMDHRMAEYVGKLKAYAISRLHT